MDRRAFIKTTTATVTGMALSTAVPAEDDTKRDDRPNMLFIMTDQQHAGMMSCTGNNWLKTPAMDSLARGGIRFERAYCANPVCVPNRISMATGVMPGRLGAFDNSFSKHSASIHDEVVENSLGRLLKRARYDTFYGGKVHMGSALAPRSAGYDEYHENDRDELPGACVAFMKKKRNRPFFAVASFINPHDIAHAYQAYKGKKTRAHVAKLYQEASALPLDQLPPLPENYAIQQDEPEAIAVQFSPQELTPVTILRQEYDEKEWRIYRWIYRRLTEQVDRHIGRILDGLHEAGLEEKTLIMFTSDHGNMDANHKLASKSFFYDESVVVPFIMKYKGVIPASRTDDKHLISTGLDILPTLCDYAEIEPPAHLLGRSLRKVAEGNPVKERRSYVASENGRCRMIRSRTFKYCVYNFGENRESLVDMESDPGEMQNLAKDPQFKEMLDRHRRFLDEWVTISNDTAGLTYVGKG